VHLPFDSPRNAARPAPFPRVRALTSPVFRHYAHLACQRTHPHDISGKNRHHSPDSLRPTQALQVTLLRQSPAPRVVYPPWCVLVVGPNPQLGPLGHVPILIWTADQIVLAFAEKRSTSLSVSDIHVSRVECGQRMYRRSKAIEDRLSTLLDLIREGRHSTTTLAKTLRVSRPTISRCLAALRERGYTIRAVRHADTWAYEISSEPEVRAKARGARR